MQSTAKLLPGLALCLAATSCKTELLHVPNRTRMQVALERLETGEPEFAVESMEGLIADTFDESDEYALQRFYAAYVLTRVHLDAWLGEPFLREPRPGGTGTFRLQSESANDTQPAPVSHQVAAVYNATLGRRWFARAKDAERQFEGELLLPDRLEAVPVNYALAYMNLAMFTVFSRFDFRDRLREVVANIPQLKDVQQCDSLLDVADITEPMRPWIYRGVFQCLSETDEITAYKFAIKTIQASPASNGSMTRNEIQPIEHWINEGSSFTFICGKGQCKQPVIPTEPRCLACQQTLSIDFVPVPKER